MLFIISQLQIHVAPPLLRHHDLIKHQSQSPRGITIRQRLQHRLIPHPVNEDAALPARTHGLDLLERRVLVVHRRLRQCIKDREGDLLGLDGLVHPLVFYHEQEIIRIHNQPAAVGKRADGGTAPRRIHVPLNRRRSVHSIIRRRDRESADLLPADAKLAAQLTEQDPVRHDGHRAEERVDAVGDLQLGHGSFGAVRVDEHHEHLVALDMRCDHGEHLVFPAELREVVHQGDGGLVDLEGREADFVAECEVCDEVADARSCDVGGMEAGWNAV